MSSRVESLLRKKSKDRNSAMKLIANADLLEIALEQGHLSIEIFFDAILIESGSWTMAQLQGFNHSLKKLAELNCRGNALILNKITSDVLADTDFSAVSSAWRMQYRYQQIRWNESDMQRFIEDFERLFLWMSKSFSAPLIN
jgi:hypothetical protein